VDEPANNESAFKFVLLEALHPEDFSFCVHFQNLPVRKGDLRRSSNDVRLIRVGWNAELNAICVCRINIQVTAGAQFLMRQFFGDGRTESRRFLEDKFDSLLGDQVLKQGHIHRIVHISVPLLRTLKHMQRRQHCDTWVHTCAPDAISQMAEKRRYSPHQPDSILTSRRCHEVTRAHVP